MKSKTHIIKKQKTKEIIKASAKAKAKIQTLIIGCSISTLAIVFTIAITNDILANTRADALLAKETKKEITLKKYKNAHKLTDIQLVELLNTVGFEGQNLKEAWAVAKKESNGRPLAHNGNEDMGDNSWGLFQINMLGELGKDRREKFGLENNAQLLDPVVNATIAYYMSRGGEDWSSWNGLTPKTKELMEKFPLMNSKLQQENN